MSQNDASALEPVEGNGVNRLLIELTAVWQCWRSMFALLLITPSFSLAAAWKKNNPSVPLRALLDLIDAKASLIRKRAELHSTRRAMQAKVSGLQCAQDL